MFSEIYHSCLYDSIVSIIILLRMIRGSKLPGMNKKDKEIEIIKQAGITYKPRSRPWMPAKCEFPDFTGGPGRTRTFGQLIKSQLLYQLSYRPTEMSPA